MTSLFSSPGRWLKGNLHTHTTNSDGHLTPAEIGRIYRDAGYDFLAITDHGRFTDPGPVQDAGLVAIPGMECHAGTNAAGELHHVVALGISEAVRVEPEHGLQGLIDAIREANGHAVLAHPYWHGCTSADLLEADGWFALEVYNQVCQAFIARGESSETWDQVLGAGRQVWGLAVDDCHHAGPDIFGGWVWVKTDEPTAPGIMQSLLSGRFYASSGPKILSVERDGDRVRVRCSPAQTIALIGKGSSGHACHAPVGELIEEAVLDWGRARDYVRLVVRDERGRGAWCNPEFV